MKKISSLLLAACIMCLSLVLPAWSDSYADRLNDGNWQSIAGEKISSVWNANYSQTYKETNGYYGKNCKLFAKRVMSEVFGVTLPGTANDNRYLVSGKVVGGLYGNFSAAAVKAVFDKSQIGDVVQMEWKWSSDISPHTFIVISHNDSGVYTLEANFHSGKIENLTHFWQDLSNAYLRDGTRGGFTIYRYIDDISGGGDDNNPPKTITITTDSSLPSTTKGTYFNKQLECTGSGSTYWEIIAGNRPDGIDVDHNSGLLRGNAERSGTFTFTVQARNDSGTGTKTFTLTVNEPGSSGGNDDNQPKTITITTDSSLPSTTKGTYFNKQLECTGSGSTYWEIISGNRPDGIDVDHNSGLLRGNAERSGTFTFTVQARNDSGTGTKQFTLTVNEPGSSGGNDDNQPKTITITTDSSLPSTTKNTDYDKLLECTGSGQTRWEVISGTCPNDIKLDQFSGRLQGKPKTSGTFAFTVQARNDSGIGTKTFTLTVNDPDRLVITTDRVLPGDNKGSGYDFHFSTNKGSARWELIGGSLPPGLKLDEGSGHLYSTFEQAGTFTFRLRAANDYGTDEKDFTITVKEPPITYSTTRWELSGNQLVIDYKASSGNTSTAKFSLTASNGDNRYIITGLPANTTVNLPANWVIDTDKRAVTVSDASKTSPLADEYGIRISGAASVKVNYEGITLTARQIQNVTRWELSGNELVLECSGKTYRFPQYDSDGDKYFVIAGLPNGAVISLPENWTADTDGRAVTVGDASKLAYLTHEGGVRISGACTIMVNYAGITFIARKVSSGSAEPQQETYTTTRWELSGSQLIVEYKSSSGAASTQRFTLQTADGDNYFIVDGLPANITISLPENWAVDTDSRAVTVSDASKISKLAPADGVRITGDCTITADYDGIIFTARQIKNTTRWEVSGNDLLIECSGKTYTFTKYSNGYDEYYIVSGLPNAAVVNLPAGWTADTDKRAVTVSDSSKVSQLTDEYGVRISGACSIMVNYSGITFVARQIPSGYRDTYVTTRWEIVDNELVVDYKASSGTENSAVFPLQTLNGDNMYIVSGLPANTTINLPANWAVDTDGRAVTVSDASKVSRLADSDGVRISGPCSITVNYDGITFTARQVHTVTRWEVVGNELVVECSGNTYTFPQTSVDGDTYFVVSGLPNGTMLTLPYDWTADTDSRAVTVSDFAKLSSLIDEYGVRISGKCTITVNYSGITFTARRVQNVTRWEVVGNNLVVECADSTYTFAKAGTNGDEYFVVGGLPNGTVINLPEGWIVDTDGRAVTVNDVYRVSSLADEYGVRIAGSCLIAVNYSGVTFTARQTQSITRWEESGNELIVEYAGDTYTFTKENKDGDEYFVVEGLPNGAVINLPEGWTADTDGRAVTVDDGYKVSPLSDEYGIRIEGPSTITVNYSGITFTVRRNTAVTQEQPEFRTHSLLLSGQIGVNFYMNLPEISGVHHANSYMDFDIAGDSSNPPQYFDSEFMNRKKTYYGFRCYIKSIQMADPITAVLHYGDGKTLTHEYSAKKYLDDSLAADIPDVERSLIEAIKDFGHYAQLYLSRVNGWELGTAHEAIDCENEYSDSDIESARQAVDENAIVKDIPEDSGIKRVGFSLNLDADTTINLYIYPEDDYSGSVAAYIPGSTANDAIYQSDRNRYKVEISNIPAHRLAETFTVRVIGKKEFDVKVSAFSYVYAALNDANAQDDEINTVVSLYRYYITNMDYRAEQSNSN
ncbi:MAG: hypothetical protein IJS39_09650 [Synergistaceae bacterium]|nr:hypothetical protein [Synergistaceae bacterium]